MSISNLSMSIRIFLSSAIGRRMVIVTYMHMCAFNTKICYVLDIISNKPHYDWCS